MSMENESAKVNTFKNILKINNYEYSHVLSIEDLLLHLVNSNHTIKTNYDYFVSNFETHKHIIAFKSFISKSVLCFLKVRDYTFSDFMIMVKSLTEIKINSNVKMFDLLSRSIQELSEREASNLTQNRNFDKTNSVYNNVQMISKGELISEKNILKNYTNRFLVNSKNFEILRLTTGDMIFSFFLQFTTLFAFEEKVQNYIQVLGMNLKTKLLNLMGATSMEKYVSGPSSSNLFSQRNNTKMNYNNAIGDRERGNNMSENERKVIPQQTFDVCRTKIFYCPNFNRKLGFFKSSLKEGKKMNKKDNNQKNYKNHPSDFFYSKLFPENCNILIPSYIETTIRDQLGQVLINLNKFDYVKYFYLYCPNSKDWRVRKTEILNKIKNKSLPEEFNQDLEELLKKVIDYDSVFKFTACFLDKVLPVDFIGRKNFKVIIKKLKPFIEMNRFESFNKISLFDLKEFSFTEMKWLQFKNMKPDTYEIFGIKLKNFIMKNIIFYIFDTLIIQLLRSHFYVTERQGSHYKSFYYQKNVWDLIMKINEIKLGAQFEYINDPYAVVTTKYEKKRRNREIAISLLKNYDLTPGKLRPMPKPTTCRPIVSYKRKTLKTNSILKNDFFETQKVFKYISTKMQSKKENCVVFDHKTIIDKLKSFKLCLEYLRYQGEEELDEQLNELKFCTMDIEACYDNINLEKLNSILDSDDIIPDVFVPHVLFVVLPKPHMLKKVKWIYKKGDNKNNFTNYNTNNNLAEVSFADCFEVKKLFFASDSNEYLHFLDFLQNKSDLNYSHCIIYQFPEIRNYIRKENFMSRVKVILNNNIIKFNKKFFRQKKGIPQGLSVSSFLCNLYFYNIEKQLSKKVNQKASEGFNRNLLLRFMDDYLCITNNQNVVHGFIDESGVLSKENKFKFNTKKCKSNCDLNKEGIVTTTNSVNTTSSFLWNGIYFELNKENSFNIYVDSKEDYDIKRFSNLINVNLPIADASWLFKKINGIFLTGHPWIYFIPSINSLEALKKNFEDFCKVVAFKLVILTNVMCKANIQPGQNSFIDIMDSCLKKLFFYFNNKIMRNDDKKFFLDFGVFSENFYDNMYAVYGKKGRFNSELIDYSPYFFKCIRRKHSRMHYENEGKADNNMNVDG